MTSTQARPLSPIDHESDLLLEEQASHIQTCQLWRHSAEMRGPHNVLVPVDRIPNDVVLEILTLLAQPASTDTPAPCDLVTATHVCGRWQRIAIYNTALWTEISIFTPKRTALFLERSRDMPVRVSLDLQKINEDASSHTDYSQILLPHIPRFRALSLQNIPSLETAKWWISQFTTTASVLEELSFAASAQEVHVGDLSIFNNHAPSLHKLSLCQVIFPPSSPVYQHLRYLSISSLTSKTLAITELLRILQRTEKLEILVLRNLVLESADAPNGPPPPRHLTRVVMTRLSTLQIIDMLPKMPYIILSYLSLPVTAEVKIDTRFCNLTDIRLPRNPTTLPALADLRALEVTFNASYSLNYVLRGKRDVCVGSRFSLSMCGTSRALRYYLVAIYCLCEALDVSAVVSLKITVGDLPSLPPDQQRLGWDLALSPLSALKTLSVDEPDDVQRYADLFRALSAHPDGPPGCPSLEELEIACPWCDDPFWARLLAMLRSRRASGCALKSVRLKEATGVVDVAAPSVLAVQALLDDFLLTSAQPAEL